MTTIVYSDFTAADSTALAGFEDWTAHPQTDDGSFPPRIMSNRLNVASGTTNRLWYRNTAPGSANYSVKAIIYRNASNNGNAGVCARMDATAATFYHLRLAGTTLQLYKFVSGAATQLGTNYSVTPAISSDTDIELVCDGTSISGKLNGATVIGPVTDSAITAAGFAGIRLSTPYFEYNDFGAYTLDAANTSPSFTGPSIDNISGTEGVALTPLDVSARFFDSESGLTFSAVGSWPAGVTVSSAGVISGTPTTAGTYASLQVRATDAGSLTADSNAFTITVAAPGDAENPTLTGSVTFASTTQTTYTAQWPAGSDNVAVTGYEYQIGSTAGAWTDAGNNLSAAITGRTAGMTETVYVRAYDAAGLRSTPAISGEVALESIPAAGINVTDPLKNNTGTVLASQSGVRVAVLQAADLVSVFETSGLTTNASGILATISDAAIITGQQYHVAIKLADGGVGITGPITAS